MKKFLIDIFLFSALLLVYFGLAATFNFTIYQNKDPELQHERVLILGDSHPQTSLDPGLFESAQNISQEGEPYIHTYWKLRKILESFRPDTIILGFAPHNISAFNDLKFSDASWSRRMFSKSYPVSAYRSLEGRIEIDYRAFYKTLWKENFLFPRFQQLDYIGMYTGLAPNHPSDGNVVINRHYYSEDRVLDVSEIAVSYLDSIIGLAKAYEIELVLVSSPLHQSYYEHIPPSIYEAYQNLKTKYGEHLIIDRSGEPYPDSLFYNSDHLNKFGARRFTLEVIGQLRTGDPGFPTGVISPIGPS